MKIAMTYLNEEIFQHYGRSEYVVVYETEGKEVLSKQVYKLEGSGHGMVSVFLQNNQVDVLICGGMGMHAKQSCDALGVKVYAGLVGNCDEVLNDFLNNRLIMDASAIHSCCH